MQKLHSTVFSRSNTTTAYYYGGEKYTFIKQARFPKHDPLSSLPLFMEAKSFVFSPFACFQHYYFTIDYYHDEFSRKHYDVQNYYSILMLVIKGKTLNIYVQ